MFEREVVKGS